MDPCVGDDGEDELCRLPPRCLVSRAVGALRFMCRFCARSDDGRSAVVDGEIVGSNPRGFGKCRALARDIFSLRTIEANEFMHRACFVIPILEKEGRNDLSDSGEVGNGRLPSHRLKLFKEMGEFCHNLLGHHCGRRWHVRHLRGQVPPYTGSIQA